VVWTPQPVRISCNERDSDQISCRRQIHMLDCCSPSDDYSQSVAFVFGPCNNNTIGKVYRGWKMNERWMIIHIIRGRDSFHVVIYYPISLSPRTLTLYCAIGKIDSKNLDTFRNILSPSRSLYYKNIFEKRRLTTKMRREARLVSLIFKPIQVRWNWRWEAI
jgi:hypothetical protein